MQNADTNGGRTNYPRSARGGLVKVSGGTIKPMVEAEKELRKLMRGKLLEKIKKLKRNNMTIILPSIEGRPLKFLWDRNWTVSFAGEFMGICFIKYQK